MRCLAVCALGGLLAAEGAFLKKEEPLVLPLPEQRHEREHLQKVEADVDRQVEAFMDKRYEANLAELQSAAAATDAQAAAAAEEAKGAAQRVEELAMKNQVLLAKAKDFGAEAEQSVKDAEASNKKLEKQLEDATADAKVADASAKELAKKAVDEMFTRKYRELDAWRKEVLTDHWAEGRYAAAKASGPYEQAMGKAMEEANKYGMASNVLTGVAKGLKDEAMKATLTAGEKRIAGDFLGAERLDSAAKAMRSHSQDLTSYAKDLQSESEHLSKEAPTYLERGLRAGRSAEYNKNPGALPPLAVNPALAYLPGL
mmetsp:Transcript_21837/g.41133  ORF Transcript_21837/g.41133 Transcript_21837/m.41133 type:complete len:314 (+) Transcript_21837:90-1031(+)